MSVGTESSSLINRTSNILPFKGAVKLRPGPLSFKMRQIQALEAEKRDMDLDVQVERELVDNNRLNRYILSPISIFKLQVIKKKMNFKFL